MVGDGTLADKFPRLYVVSNFKEKVISDFGVWIRNGSLEGFIWQIPWRRELFEWEKGLEKQLVEIVLSTK